MPEALDGGRPGRGVPDIAVSATDYFVRVHTAEVVSGGTSAVAPLMASLVTLLNHAKQKSVGFLNPFLSANAAAGVVRKLRAKIHAQICKRGFHAGLNSFTQASGTRHMDASLLMLPLVGFLPIEDPRIDGTIRAIEERLMRRSLLIRYDTQRVKDGLPAGEGAFLACNFWLVDVYVMQGRMAEATALFEKLLALGNEYGLLSEEYDEKYGLIGNFPQAFSHIGLVNAALTLEPGQPVRLRYLD